MDEANARLSEGWEFRVTRLSEEFTLEDWRNTHPKGIAFADLNGNGALRFLSPQDEPRDGDGIRLLALVPGRADRTGA
ncbi:hypothetical protein IMCC21224_112264 [Puniceibacterium sp. IMCC21224]|nr:hypothetical protein IMCC21224_112264 [Puniceibacterium sp. IMCC21224]